MAARPPTKAHPTTLRAAAGLPAVPPKMHEATLIVIDAQLEYTTGALPLPHVADAIDRIAELLGAARELGRPVVHILHQGPAGGLFDPAGAGACIAGVDPLPHETIVRKRLPNAFADTDLSEHLVALGNPPLILTGFMTHMCVSSTARVALDLGLTTTVVADATATRVLPLPLDIDDTDQPPVSAEALQLASLAALADRFSVVTETASLLAAV